MSEHKNDNAAKLPCRPYGRAKIPLSIIGLGGLVISDAEQEYTNHLVAKAIERGVNYFDVAPSYGDAELKLAQALRPYRNDVFLACKTIARTADQAAAQLASSLERLETDHLDLYQLHALNDLEKDVDVAFGAGGAMELFIEAKRSGRVRHIGFSTHTSEAGLAAMDRHEFDSILFPVNFAAYYKGNFGPAVIAKAQAHGTSILALKALAGQPWPEGDPQRQKYRGCWYKPLTDRRQAALALSFSLSQPVTAALTPANDELFWLAVELAMDFTPIRAAQTDELKQLAAKLDPIFSTPAQPPAC